MSGPVSHQLQVSQDFHHSLACQQGFLLSQLNGCYRFLHLLDQDFRLLELQDWLDDQHVLKLRSTMLLGALLEAENRWGPRGVEGIERRLPVTQLATQIPAGIRLIRISA